MTDKDLEKRIYELSEQVASGFATTSSQLESMSNSIKKLEHHIDGNGSEGIRIQVDRLREANDRRQKREWWFAGILGSMFVVLIGVIAKWLMQGG